MAGDRVKGPEPGKNDSGAEQLPSYGQAKYRGRRETRKAEEDDIDAFLRLAVGLDRDASLTQALLDLTKKVEAVVTDPFLSDSSWRVWDEHEVLDRQKRLAMAVGTPRNKTLLPRLKSQRLAADTGSAPLSQFNPEVEE